MFYTWAFLPHILTRCPASSTEIVPFCRTLDTQCICCVISGMMECEEVAVRKCAYSVVLVVVGYVCACAWEINNIIQRMLHFAEKRYCRGLGGRRGALMTPHRPIMLYYSTASPSIYFDNKIWLIGAAHRTDTTREKHRNYIFLLYVA